jgi:hypothetical protein
MIEEVKEEIDVITSNGFSIESLAKYICYFRSHVPNTLYPMSKAFMHLIEYHLAYGIKDFDQYTASILSEISRTKEIAPDDIAFDNIQYCLQRGFVAPSIQGGSLREKKRNDVVASLVSFARYPDYNLFDWLFRRNPNEARTLVIDGKISHDFLCYVWKWITTYNGTGADNVFHALILDILSNKATSRPMIEAYIDALAVPVRDGYTHAKLQHAQWLLASKASCMQEKSLLTEERLSRLEENIQKLLIRG